MMTELKKLLTNGNASDRKSVVEVLARIGAAVTEQESSISPDIEVLYDQIVEDCKRDREAHLDMLLKLTQFAIMTLGPKFSKYMDFVFPLIIENAQILVVEEKMEGIKSAISINPDLTSILTDIEHTEEDDEDLLEIKKDVSSKNNRLSVTLKGLVKEREISFFYSIEVLFTHSLDERCLSEFRPSFRIKY